MQLEGKAALITGSTQGLGAGIARRYVRAGASVVLTGRSETRGQAVREELRVLNPDVQVEFIQADISRLEEAPRLITRAVECLGRLDILVNSAADTQRSTLENMTPELFDYQFNLNVKAPLFLAQAALSALRSARGVIINIGSVNAYMGGSELLSYSATKGALMTASRNLANALKHERVRVYCLNIGWTDTDGERVIQAQEGHAPDYLDKIGSQRPIGRLLRPEDIAGMCLYLASDDAHAFSGAVIDLEQSPVGSSR